MRFAIAFTITFLGACFAPDFSAMPVCGPAGECPAGLLCRSTPEADVCVGSTCPAVDDPANPVPCRTTDIPVGYCLRETCVAAGCGDGVVFGDEVCDDGNNVEGDGCSPTCNSDETCGNGVTDESREACDDGSIAIQGDGCSTTCKLELDGWHELLLPVTAPHPSALGAAISYDTDRARAVSFGGTNISTISSETLEFDGTMWSLLFPTTVPPQRIFAAMAYDEAHHVTLLSGGIVLAPSSTALSDLWKWNGTTWSALPSIDARFGHAMVYDRKHARVIVVGGAATNAADTEGIDTVFALVDGARTPIATPADYHGTFGVSAAYDATREVVVIYGGASKAGTVVDDTWILDGDAWTHVAVPSPPARAYAMTVYDPLRGTIVVAGGNALAGSLADTWEWNGETWSSRRAIDPFFARGNGAAIYDVLHRRMIVFGGSTTTRVFDDAWSFEYRSVRIEPGESCLPDQDLDGDGLAGCTDPDCWYACRPHCPPHAPASGECQ